METIDDVRKNSSAKEKYQKIAQRLHANCVEHHFIFSLVFFFFLKIMFYHEIFIVVLLLYILAMNWFVRMNEQ